MSMEGARWKDTVQDRIPNIITDVLPHGEINIHYPKIHIVFPDDLNDFGLSNIDYETAERLKDRYHIEIPKHLSLGKYLCTDEGCARFTAAAIREAQDELESYISTLPPDKRAIINNLNREELDALLVTIYKRGIEKTRVFLDGQLQKLVEKGNRQRYLYIGEGYLAWNLWVVKDPANARWR